MTIAKLKGLAKIVESLNKEVNHEILATPTGEERNDLTEINIHLIAVSDKMSDLLHKKSVEVF